MKIWEEFSNKNSNQFINLFPVFINNKNEGLPVKDKILKNFIPFDIHWNKAEVQSDNQILGPAVSVGWPTHITNSLFNENSIQSNSPNGNGFSAVAFQFNSDVPGGADNVFANNAGIAGPSFKTWEYPLEEWKQVIDIDLNGVFYCSKSIVPHMIKANYGRIVNIASIAGKEGNPNAMPYSAAKAGVIALTKSLGKELSNKNIAVNCVTPAAAKTRIFDQMTEEHINYMLSKIPRNKFAKVEELASLVTWLSSEENSFSTAAVFDLSGGRATY